MSREPEGNCVTHFCNPIAEGADPWVVRSEGHYYWCLSAAGRGVFVFRSDRLTSLGERHLVWTAPATGPHSRQVWAPELHRLDDQWYIYTTASDGNNATHRVIVLESESGTPLGPYRLKAELYTGDDHATGARNRWAIDATVLTHAGRRFLIWSGWAADADEQWLYIAPLSDPWTVSGNRVRVCANDDHRWERVDESLAGRGLNEAPQVLQHGGRTFVVFSASGSWQPSYKLGLLELTGANPLEPADWTKSPDPVFVSTAATWGVGHCGFTTSPDGKEPWMVYHAKENRTHDWQRSILVQPFGFARGGRPEFGQPVDRGAAVPIPSGQRTFARSGDFTGHFAAGWGAWDYYGHQDLISCRDGRLYLGDFEEHLAMFRSGEKLLLRDRAWSRCEVAATITLLAPDAILGVLLRAENPRLGHDGQDGVFVGLEVGAVVVSQWRQGQRSELLRCAQPVVTGIRYELVLNVTATGLEMISPWSGMLVEQLPPATGGGIGIRLEKGRGAVDSFAVRDGERPTA